MQAGQLAPESPDASRLAVPGRPDGAGVGLLGGFFAVQQRALAVEAVAVAAEGAVFADDAVAGDDDRRGLGGVAGRREVDRLGGGGAADAG
jgi:hypothetical protein